MFKSLKLFFGRIILPDNFACQIHRVGRGSKQSLTAICLIIVLTKSQVLEGSSAGYRKKTRRERIQSSQMPDFLGLRNFSHINVRTERSHSLGFIYKNKSVYTHKSSVAFPITSSASTLRSTLCNVNPAARTCPPPPKFSAKAAELNTSHERILARISPSPSSLSTIASSTPSMSRIADTTSSTPSSPAPHCSKSSWGTTVTASLPPA